MATMTVEIDKAGRIVVPKKLRDALHLTPGTQLTVERRGNSLVMEPEVGYARVVIENGLPLIYPADPKQTPQYSAEYFDALLQQIRDERDRHNLGLDDDTIELDRM